MQEVSLGILILVNILFHKTHLGLGLYKSGLFPQFKKLHIGSGKHNKYFESLFLNNDAIRNYIKAHFVTYIYEIVITNGSCYIKLQRC